MIRDCNGVDGENLILDILSKLAAHEGIDPIDLHPPLYEAIDPELIEKLFRSNGFELVQFSYHGHLITVHQDHRIEIG